MVKTNKTTWEMSGSNQLGEEPTLEILDLVGGRVSHHLGKGNSRVMKARHTPPRPGGHSAKRRGRPFYKLKKSPGGDWARAGGMVVRHEG